MYIYSWNPGSESARELSRALNIRRIKHENSNFRGRANKTVINWGATRLPEQVSLCHIINRADRVAACSDKLRFFREMDNNHLPDWCEDLRTAIRWIEEGSTVMARTVLNGHSARGLVIMDSRHPQNFVEAPLYTRYVPKKDEYRIHVFRGNVLDVQKKVIRRERLEEEANGGPPVNWKVRNLDNGFVYQRENLPPTPQPVLNAAVNSVRIINLDFGAVDIIFRQRENKAYVLEINTAPGLEGTTIQNYANAFRNLQ